MRSYYQYILFVTFGLMAVLPTAVSAADDDDTLIPSLRGVTLAPRPKEATWCVTKGVATVLDATTHKHVGTVAGGRFLLIKGRERFANTGYYRGDFTPKSIGRDVCISSADVYALTGSPDALSETQRIALRKYYELKGDAASRASKLAAETGSASPYYDDLVKAYAEHKQKVEQFARLKAAGKFDQEGLRRAQYKLSGMKEKVANLNAKHKAWKTEHGEKKTDPTEDAEYKRITEEAKKQAALIPGLAL